MRRKISLPPYVGWVRFTLRDAGYRACPVGGAVRDCLMGRTPVDWDLCTSAPPEDIEALFPRTVRTGRGFGTVTVVTGSGKVEVTPFRTEAGYSDNRRPDGVRFGASLEEDLARRDFTVNAMALAEDGSVVDLFGGREDLGRGLIRCVGEPERRFTEDALRMLRAVRFSAQLDFEIEADTAEAIRRCAPLAARLSGERVRAELEKTLLSPRPERAGEMIGYGLLDHLYPFPRDCDLSGLAALPCTKEDRWRGFCAATGFSISRLPVERKLRRAVEQPELALIPALALRPAELMALGLSGPEISAAQRRLARHVLRCPEDNAPERLKQILASQEHILSGAGADCPRGDA